MTMVVSVSMVMNKVWKTGIGRFLRGSVLLQGLVWRDGRKEHVKRMSVKLLLLE